MKIDMIINMQNQHTTLQDTTVKNQNTPINNVRDERVGRNAAGAVLRKQRAMISTRRTPDLSLLGLEHSHLSIRERGIHRSLPRLLSGQDSVDRSETVMFVLLRRGDIEYKLLCCRSACSRNAGAKESYSTCLRCSKFLSQSNFQNCILSMQERHCQRQVLGSAQGITQATASLHVNNGSRTRAR
jgi:hypothetical protein